MHNFMATIALLALPLFCLAQGTTNNISGTIATGGVFQQIAPQQTSRRTFEFQNICLHSGNCSSTTDNCYVFFGPTASATVGNSILISPNTAYFRNVSPVPQEAIQITCDGSGDKFYGALQQ